MTAQPEPPQSFLHASPRLMAVRGATTVSFNTIEAIQADVAALLSALVAANPVKGAPLSPADMVSVFFTVTPDITAISAAKVARLALGWDSVAMMCAQEPEVEGLPKLCVRIMIQYYGDTPAQQVYLKGAKALRPDLYPETTPAA